ncbi:MAG: HAMP domain-containing histidine kinase, partial [Clostridia bacterium]|nr:HAMP domain-containing histidine kinase [Clostridia bacterium]
MSTKNTATQVKKRSAGIRVKLVIALVAFTVLVLLAIWILQIRLLSYFYEREKFSELEETYLDICTYIGDKKFTDQLQKTAEENGICIRVFTIIDGMAKEVGDGNAGVNCMIHHLSSSLLEDLYVNAKMNNGVYDKRMEFNTDFVTGDAENFYLPGLLQPADTVNAICARLIEKDGAEYFILLDCELTPVSATVKTLQVQFLWTAFFLLCGAILFAFILSRIIATPLSAITEKARKLAVGNYTADFEGRGYREIAELAETLNFAAREIGATDNLQKELIANISHDLRTPLTMIKGYSEIMRDLPGENNAENAQIIIDETTRLSELVSDLLDISKLQAGTKKPEPE